MDFSKHIFRSHMVGQIICPGKPLTNTQIETLETYRLRFVGEGKKLTEKQKEVYHFLEVKLSDSKKIKFNTTAEKALTNLVFNEKWNRRKHLDVKQIHKGLNKEKEARDVLSAVLGGDFFALTEDTERKSNEFVTGQRDIKHDDLIIDIKSSWSFDSFNTHLLSNPNEVYLCQLDCYMDLWNIKNSLLAHVLVDTPMKLVDDEVKRFLWKYEAMNMESEVLDFAIPEVIRIVSNLIFSREGLEQYCLQSPTVHIEWFTGFKEIPKEERVHLISHEYDQARIDQRNACIVSAREYMSNVKPLNNITINQ